MIISVLNPKGGAGKSTIATNLVTAYHRAGQRVLLVDSDPQGSARDWAAIDPHNMVEVVGMDRPELFKTLPRTAENYDLVFVDGAAKLENMLVASVKVSDFVIIPVQPSWFDVWSLEKQLIPLLHARLELAERPTPIFLLNAAAEGTILSRETMEALEAVGFSVFETVIYDREAYPQQVKKGSSVFESKDRKAIQEIRSLHAEFDEYIENQYRALEDELGL